jgi:predicted HicB family RNase H-like nuclease
VICTEITRRRNLRKTKSQGPKRRIRPSVNVTLGPRVLAAVNAKAKREECSLSQMISLLLHDSLSRSGDLPRAELCEAQ